MTMCGPTLSVAPLTLMGLKVMNATQPSLGSNDKVELAIGTLCVSHQKLINILPPTGQAPPPVGST
jgi:hypothetical protein